MAHILWVLVLRQFKGQTSVAHTVEFSELPCQSPELGKTGKYTPSRAGPMRKIPYWTSSAGPIFSRIAQLRTLA